MNNNNKRVPWARYALSMAAITLFSAAYAGNSRYNFLRNKTRTSFNFTIVNNLIVIPAKINGMDLNLILDSGMRSIVLFERDFGDKIKTLDNYTVKLSGYGKKKNLPSKLSLDNEVIIADVLGSKVPVVIMSESNMLRKALVNIDGIIGYEIFSRFIVKIDYLNKKITLHEPFDNPENYNYEILPLTVKDTKPYIQASVETDDGETIKGQFHIDTGSYHDVMLFVADQDNLNFKDLDYTSLGIGIGGRVKGFVAPESSLKIGSDMNKRISPKYVKRQFSNRELDAKGSIGSGLLKDSVIVLDYINMKFYIQKEPVLINQFAMSSVDI
ncbi:MAG TPA: hypothetical protein PKL31_01630 [Fulvivirga sp.]|nr:hypothetical protein [Fulvivirga sp.]